MRQLIGQACNINTHNWWEDRRIIMIHQNKSYTRTNYVKNFLIQHKITWATEVPCTTGLSSESCALAYYTWSKVEDLDRDQWTLPVKKPLETTVTRRLCHFTLSQSHPNLLELRCPWKQALVHRGTAENYPPVRHEVMKNNLEDAQSHPLILSIW